MSPIITVENLSKKYIIGHQKQERYIALRDVLANGVKRFAHKLSHPFAVPEIDPVNEEFWALKNVNFEVQQGDRVGVIGRNGAGKSTLLKILSRITEPTSGKIAIRGRVASLLEVGTGFHPELTGRENVYLNGAILGMSKAEIRKKFDEIVAFAEVEKFLDTPVKHFSSGMYVRLAFAVAAHLEPEILIVDEVLAVGDVQFQKKCMGKMAEVGKEGRTVLFVSHNVAAVRALCGRVILLETGSLVCDGNLNQGLERYLNVGNRQGTTEITLPENYPRFGNGMVKLQRVELMDRQGEPLSTLNYGQPFQLALTIELKEPIRDEIMAMVYIVTLEGTRFGLSYNVQNGSAGWRLSVGRYRIIVDIDSVLLPFVNYSFDVGMYARSGMECYDFVEQIIQVGVSPTAEDGVDHYPGSQSHAYVRVASEWHFPRLLDK